MNKYCIRYAKKGNYISHSFDTVKELKAILSELKGVTVDCNLECNPINIKKICLSHNHQIDTRIMIPIRIVLVNATIPKAAFYTLQKVNFDVYDYNPTLSAAIEKYVMSNNIKLTLGKIGDAYSDQIDYDTIIKELKNI